MSENTDHNFNASDGRCHCGGPSSNPAVSADPPAAPNAQWVLHPDITDVPDEVLTPVGKALKAAQQAQHIGALLQGEGVVAVGPGESQ